MARTGRPRLPVELHLLRGTYRRDRHGPLPAVAAAPTGSISATPRTDSTVCETATPAPALTGGALVQAIRQTWVVDDVADATALQTIQVCTDRRQALDLLLDGPDGLLQRVATGQISAASVKALLTAQALCTTQLVDALRTLDLDTSATRRRNGSVSAQHASEIA